jgi:hypothetical protein
MHCSAGFEEIEEGGHLKEEVLPSLFTRPAAEKFEEPFAPFQNDDLGYCSGNLLSPQFQKMSLYSKLFSQDMVIGTIVR